MICDKQTVWQQIEIHTPDEWEMLRYGKESSFGVSTFSDLYKERLQVAWQKDTECPDMERFVSDVKSKYITDYIDEEPPEFFPPARKISGWHGIVILVHGEYTVHMAKFFNKHKTLVEITMFHGEERDMSLERELCSKIRIVEPDNGLQFWHAFGMRFTVPEEYHLEKTTINPGDVKLSYTSEKLKGKKQHYPYVSLHSLAFPELVLDGKEPEEWLKDKLPQYTKITNTTKASDDQNYLVVVESQRRRGHFKFLFGAKYYRQDIIAVSTAEKRIFHITKETIKADAFPKGEFKL